MVNNKRGGAVNNLQLGDAVITPQIENGFLHSIGAARVGDMLLRGDTRWLPWFDAFEGGVFDRFRFEGIEQRGDTTVLRTTALSSNDYPFRERRDASGDICFHARSWDATPLESELDICFQSAQAEIDGREFSGFKFWFEYSGATAIHRLVDRQTWEPGGTIENLNLVCRNWLTPPRVRLSRDSEYSTVGLDEWSALLPGNLWARWSLLPAFDFLYGNSGVLVGYFDEVSLIRTVIESGNDEDALRVLDMHLFAQNSRVQTNPKTILYCPDILDDVDALNLWTRIHDLESAKTRVQLNLPEEEPPAIICSQNVWSNIRFNSSYEHAIEVASEFGADYLFIDPVWEHQKAWEETLESAVPREKQSGTIFEKWRHDTMCSTLDFEVAEILGGEIELKKLCERAAEKDLKILSWMATHLSPNSVLMTEENQAVKESARHPDTGYAASCWPIRGGSPAWQRMSEQLLAVCERTGLKGFLWDSFSNLGWWHLDYASGSMAPQWPHTIALYRDLENAGLYLMSEAIVSFSGHSCVGLHGGNIYEGDLLAFSYNTNTALSWDHADRANLILCGEEPFDMFFQCLAHKRVPSFSFHFVPRDKWHEPTAEKMKNALYLYKRFRNSMTRRTVLHDGQGVLWESDNGQRLVWSFTRHLRNDGPWTNCATDITTETLDENEVYIHSVV